MGAGSSFFNGNAAGLLSWLLTVSSAKVKNEWSYACTPPYALDMDNFTCTLLYQFYYQ